MSPKLIAFLNLVYSTVDPNWKSTDDIPDLVLEGFKEILPEILLILKAIKIGA